jgi:hypothetical protein
LGLYRTYRFEDVTSNGTPQDTSRNSVDTLIVWRLRREAHAFDAGRFHQRRWCAAGHFYTADSSPSDPQPRRAS